MGLSPEKMAEFLAGELIDDIDLLCRHLLELENRWTQYGEQYEHLLSLEKRAELEACMQRFQEQTKHVVD